QLAGVDTESVLPGQRRAQQGDPTRRIGYRRRPVRRRTREHQPEFGIEGFGGFPRGTQVAVMDRIECATEDGQRTLVAHAKVAAARGSAMAVISRSAS